MIAPHVPGDNSYGLSKRHKKVRRTYAKNVNQSSFFILKCNISPTNPYIAFSWSKTLKVTEIRCDISPKLVFLHLEVQSFFSHSNSWRISLHHILKTSLYRCIHMSHCWRFHQLWLVCLVVIYGVGRVTRGVLGHFMLSSFPSHPKHSRCLTLAEPGSVSFLLVKEVFP